MLHDVFICHASEDKEKFVRPLAEFLKSQHLDVWYDEFALNVGDSLRQAIDKGLANSRFGIVVLSKNFFQKRWAQRELNGLVSREVSEDRRLVLPVWHEIERSEIIKHSPTLADVFAVTSKLGVRSVATELLKVLRPEGSPLIVARDFLIKKGLTPPVVTDEWWLDLIEYKEAILRSPDLNNGNRWIFPLPYLRQDRGRERGINIAWAALQLDWAGEGEDKGYCQLTNPEIIHDYLRKWPGLLECARANPGILAMYVPQLTIPGFDDGLADVFDKLMLPDRDDAYQMPGYGGGPDTVDGNSPLCGELIAWRHPTFGNYQFGELSDSFVTAYNSNYSRRLHDSFDCLTWLLSKDASWLPSRVHAMLVKGLHERTYGWSGDVMRRSRVFFEALLKKRSGFRFTRTVHAALNEMISESLRRVGSTDDPASVSELFITQEFVDSYYAEKLRIRAMRKL